MLCTAHIRDPFGVTHPVKNWKLRLLEMAAPNPPQQVINKLLSEVVSRTQPLSSDSSAFTPEGQMRGLAQLLKLTMYSNHFLLQFVLFKLIA